MFSRAAVRATTQVAGRRGFHATRSQMSSPYHYPEGPYTNIPFNPKAKTFPLLFWGFCAGGFGAPFLIASALYGIFTPAKACSVVLILFVSSVANLQAQGISNESIRVGDHGWLICLAMMDYRRKSRAKPSGWIDSTIDVLQQSNSFCVSESRSLMTVYFSWPNFPWIKFDRF